MVLLQYLRKLNLVDIAGLAIGSIFVTHSKTATIAGVSICPALLAPLHDRSNRILKKNRGNKDWNQPRHYKPIEDDCTPAKDNTNCEPTRDKGWLRMYYIGTRQLLRNYIIFLRIPSLNAIRRSWVTYPRCLSS
jgi:hypothetical protein